jgi:hypothetical protein
MPPVPSGLRPRRVVGAFLLLAVAAVLLQGAGLPHTHATSKPGLYNQDHDLVLLATLHGAAVVAEAAPAPLVFDLIAAFTAPVARPPASAARSTSHSRARTQA